MIACLRACVTACTCVCIRDLPWQGYIISDQCLCSLASRCIYPLPLERASPHCPTSNYWACYHDETILLSSLSPCSNSHTHPQTDDSSLPGIPCDRWYPSLTKSLQINFVIQFNWKKHSCVWLCVRVCVYYIYHFVETLSFSHYKDTPLLKVSHAGTKILF